MTYFVLNRNRFSLITYIYLLIILSSSFLTGNNETYSSENRIIIEIASIDYHKYIKSNPPLDRLYAQDDKYYFIISEKEHLKLLTSEIRSNIIKTFSKKNKTLNLSKTSNDYNGNYHNYNETKDLLDDLQDRFPDNARVFSIGRSVEGRNLNIIHISNNINVTINKPNVFIIGCHHAREWISVEVPLLFAKYLLEHQNNDRIKTALNGANIYILPILNPDGLEFSIHNYRYWRKNRKYNGDFKWGVDLNRNYGYMWGIDDQGSSPSQDSEVYRGSSPFSEPETEALRQFLLTNPPDGSISYHNFSQLILIPWGYKYERPEDYTELETIASEMSSRIFDVNGRHYDYGGSEALYLVNGSSDDWIYGTFKTPSFTIELPPTGSLTGGFFTSEEDISLAFNENLPALLYFINYIIDRTPVKKEKIIDIENNKASILIPELRYP